MAEFEVQPEDRFAALIEPGLDGGPRARRFPVHLVAPAVAILAIAVAGFVLGGKTPAVIVLPMPPPPIADNTETVLPPTPAPNGAAAMALAAPVAPAAPAQAAASAPASVSASPASASPTPAQTPAAATASASAANSGTGTPQTAADAVPVVPSAPADGAVTPSYDLLPPLAQPAVALAIGPVPTLQQASSFGPLPVQANGQMARIAYAAPAAASAGKPRLAVVVVGLGLERDPTNAAISRLPGAVDVAFTPYGGSLDQWVANARSNGHEALLELPLEPPNFPNTDGGPLAVMSRDSPAEAINRLDTVLGKATSYVGVVATPRSPVAASASWTPVLRELASRGLLYVGDGLTGVAPADLPAAVPVTVVADDMPFAAAIDARLAQALAAARKNGSATVMISALPVSLSRLLAFLPTLGKNGVTLVPVSALAQPAPVVASASAPHS